MAEAGDSNELKAHLHRCLQGSINRRSLFVSKLQQRERQCRLQSRVQAKDPTM